MGVSLRDHYHQELKAFDAKVRHKARSSYLEANRALDPALRARRAQTVKGYRPPASQRRMNLDG